MRAIVRMSLTLRRNNIERLDRRVYDALIIGGGINGAVAASALTSQGAATALIERGDFAGFTSQESSNLAWGGIKYLETYEFGLVANLCKSRNHLMRSYPSMVREIRFFTTIARSFRKHRYLIFMGTLLYWLIGRFFTKPPRVLSRKDINREEPVINTDNAQGGLEYSDAILVDNDARFVFRFIRAALDHGGIVANYVESMGSKKVGEYWVTDAIDRISGKRITIQSKVIINACGPYVEEQNARSKMQAQHKHVFSKGVHLMVNRITKHKRVLAFFADDGRLFFVIPMGNKTCIGTTDTRVEKLPAQVTAEDRTFILENINKRLRLPKPLTEADIIAERCGVRPLVVNKGGDKQDTGDWTSLSRKHATEVDAENRFVSIFGGKLTDCLNIGEEVSEAMLKLGVNLPYRGIRWYGEAPDQIRDEFFHQATLMDLDSLTAEESSEALSTRLWRRYGASALDLLEEIREDPAQAEVLIQGTEYIRCEIHHAAAREMIVKLEDFLRRRSKIALLERPAEMRNSPGLMEACRILFGKQARMRFDEYFRDHPVARNQTGAPKSKASSRRTSAKSARGAKVPRRKTVRVR